MKPAVRPVDEISPVLISQLLQHSQDDPEKVLAGLIQSIYPMLFHLFSIKAIFLSSLIPKQYDNIDVLHL